MIPQSMEPTAAENAVIGTLLLDPSLMPRFLDLGVSAKWFSGEITREIWNVVEDAHLGGVNWDGVFVCDAIGDHETPFKLMESVFTTAHWREYAKMLGDVHLCTAIRIHQSEAPWDTQGLSDLVAAHQRRFNEESQDTDGPQEILKALADNLLSGKNPIEVRTPFKTLNLKMNGLERGKLLVIGGRPGHHKTNFALNLIIEALKDGEKIVYADYELGKTDLLARLAAIYTGIPFSEIVSARDGMGRDIGMDARVENARALGVLAPHLKNLHLLQNSPLREVDEMAGKVGARIVVIDHIQSCAEAQVMRKDTTTAQHISDTCRFVKAMALNRGLTAIVPAQLNRLTDGPARKHEYKGSGGIEEYGDVLMSLWYPAKEWKSQGQDQPCEGLKSNRKKPLEAVPDNVILMEFAKSRSFGPVSCRFMVTNDTGKIMEITDRPDHWTTRAESSAEPF